MIKYRFPGLNAYSKEDAPIFKGRDEDSLALYNLVLLNKTLVLHADSGVGKSSLIQAGLLPLIERQNGNTLQTIIIKLTDIKPNPDDVNILTQFVISKIIDHFHYLRENQLSLIDNNSDSFWILNKKSEKNNKSFFLIFDQFEYLQSFTKEQIYLLKQELFNLVNPKIPSDIYSSIEEKISLNQNEIINTTEINEEYNFLSLPSRARLLFVIREDKLGFLSTFCDVFPDILKNDFIIDPLSIQDAFHAINDPALLEDDQYKSKAFRFENDQLLIDLIEKIADKDSLVDPTQLQIVARDLERNVVIAKNKTVIKKNDISEVSDIIKKYYSDSWDNITDRLKFSDSDVSHHKKKILPNLIENDRRIIVSAGSEIALFDELYKQGLVRKIISDGYNYYQLTHDRLIEPIKNDLLTLEEKEIISSEKDWFINRLKKQWISVTTFLVVCLTLAIGFILWQKVQENKKKNQLVEEAFRELSFSKGSYLKSLEDLDYNTAILKYSIFNTKNYNEFYKKYKSKTVQDTFKSGIMADSLFIKGKYEEAIKNYNKISDYLKRKNGNTNKITNIINNYKSSKEAFKSWDKARTKRPDSLVSSIYIEGRGMNILPDDVKKFSKLKEIGLNKNNYEQIPPILLKINTLTTINLQENNIKEIPENISSLQNLIHLNLNYNQISEIPNGLTKIQGLKYLTLKNNKISHIPNKIINMDYLETLTLSENFLHTFPLDALKLRNLKELDLNNCMISEIPEQNILSRLMSLSKLRLINFNNNPITIKGDFYNQFGQKIIIKQKTAK